jgi:hypothetical protein
MILLIKMLLLLLFYFDKIGACVWYKNPQIFPKNLVRLESPQLHRRRLADVVEFPQRVAELVESEHLGRRLVDVIGSVTNVYNGLDTSGRVKYSVIYDATVGVHDYEYRVESITPFTNIVPRKLSGLTTLVRMDHGLSDALNFTDTMVVTLSAWSPCLPSRALGHSTYAFNVVASYKMFHSYNATLETDNGGAIVLYQVPRSNSTHTFVFTPCLDTYIQSSIRVLNTSSHTQWMSERWANDGGGTPRCHFKHHGSVCTVVAIARFEYGHICSRPVTFSLWQAVSQVSRQQRQLNFTKIRPDNFDANRREPIADGPDMRYDMCEARVCSGDGCTPVSIQNNAVAMAGHIKLNQSTLTTSGVLETECRFEVVGFMDDLWSPWIYFRQAVGFDVHFDVHEP